SGEPHGGVRPAGTYLRRERRVVPPPPAHVRGGGPVRGGRALWGGRRGPGDRGRAGAPGPGDPVADPARRTPHCPTVAGPRRRGRDAVQGGPRRRPAGGADASRPRASGVRRLAATATSRLRVPWTAPRRTRDV